jgi:uncharacterized membrane protein YvlD (DUF360 family)
MKKGAMLQLIAVIICIASLGLFYDINGPNMLWRVIARNTGMSYTYWFWAFFIIPIILGILSIWLFVWGYNQKHHNK